MVGICGVISRLKKCKVLVIGDMILDTYTIGKAKRISPEAPVAIINVLSEESRPGGAGNVMLNLISLNAEVVAIGRIGQDRAGNELKSALASENIDLRGVFVQPGFVTPEKQRVIAENQQIVRVDYERVTPLDKELENRILTLLPELLEEVALVAISDYGKGFLTDNLLKALIKESNARKIPIIADPKGTDFKKYDGVTVIKPNLSEVYAAAGMTADADLDAVGAKVLEIAGAETLMVTRAEAGISLFHKDGSRQDFSVRAREVKDVTGAGDTVLAMLSYALANHLSLPQAVMLSNVAAGIAIERVGCARVTLAQLACRLLEDDVGNKVFDGEHIHVLKQALDGRPYSLLAISENNGLTPASFSAIRQLAKQREVLIYLLENQPEEDFVSMLASLHDVKFIITQNESLSGFCASNAPQGIYIISNKELLELDSIQELFIMQ